MTFLLVKIDNIVAAGKIFRFGNYAFITSNLVDSLLHSRKILMQFMFLELKIGRID